jgi:Cu+-exporting ATPase
MNNGLKTRRSGRLRLRRPGPAMTTAPEITDRVQVELAVGGMTCAACAARVQARLNKVTGVTALARATFATIRRNLAWAFCYNVLAIPLAALGFLNPLVAAATMTLSSVFVVWNSLRLRRFAARPR